MATLTGWRLVNQKYSSAFGGAADPVVMRPGDTVEVDNGVFVLEKPWFLGTDRQLYRLLVVEYDEADVLARKRHIRGPGAQVRRLTVVGEVSADDWP